jgi:ribose 5-phosphate isomerase B
MKIYIGNDHRGVTLKKAVCKRLTESGHTVVNLGVDSNDPVDYPDQAEAVATSVVADPGSIGILFCGSGVGVQISANKIKGVRAAQVWDPWIAEYARRHNDANVITFSNERQTHDDIIGLIEIFLAAKFEGERHATRVDKIAKLDANRESQEIGGCCSGSDLPSQ